MKKTTIVKQDVEVTTDVLCNKCGYSCKHGEPVDVFDFCGLIEVKVCGGYFSPILEDEVEYTFSLCEKCLDELFKSFKIDIEKTDYPIMG